MDERQRKKALYWVLVFALLFGLLNLKSIMSIGGKRTAADLQGQGAVSTPLPAASAVPDSFAYERLTPAKEARLALDFGRNPFYRGEPAAATAPVSNAPVFRVSAISQRGSSAFAVVNGKVVKAGDTVEGFLVKDISNGKVTLSQGESVWRFSVKGD